MLKKFLIGLVLIIVIAAFGFYSWVNSGIELPPETDKIIAEVVAADNIPEFITGETGFAKNGEVDIWYEKISVVDTVKATVLLVMGHSATALIWTPDFYQAFVDSGYQVIRYDNRGLGESDWIDNWDKNNPYTLEDMAKDGIAILDAVGVDKAHIVGASMGGMIGQRLAISHSDRVLSLTSIMSSGYMNDPKIDPIPGDFIPNLTKLVLKNVAAGAKESNMLEIGVGVQELLKGNGPYETNIKESAERTLYEIRKRKGINPTVGDQHTAAIETSGSRLEELGSITVPTLVIHGKSDPLVIFSHAEKYAPLIPNAKTLFIDGMGHDLPSIYMNEIQSAMFQIMD